MRETVTLCHVLRKGLQADPDGVFVKVSREAVDVAASTIEAFEARTGFHKADRGYEVQVLWALHNVEISVGKACELLRDYIANGVEGRLPGSGDGGE